jgi:hypothetical protein
MSDLFLYNNIVVVLTGRKAIKEQPKRRRRAAGAEDNNTDTDCVFEITPQDKEEGSWTKWVRLTDLYTIVDSKDYND